MDGEGDGPAGPTGGVHVLTADPPVARIIELRPRIGQRRLRCCGEPGFVVGPPCLVRQTGERGGDPEQADREVDESEREAEKEGEDDLRPFERGPELTETR